MHGHNHSVIFVFRFVSSFIILNRGGRAGNVFVVVVVVVVLHHRLRSFITIYLPVDSSLTTWLVSDTTKHAGRRCDQSLSIFISSQVEPQSPWVIHHRSTTRATQTFGLRFD